MFPREVIGRTGLADVEVSYSPSLDIVEPKLCHLDMFFLMIITPITYPLHSSRFCWEGLLTNSRKMRYIKSFMKSKIKKTGYQ